MVIYMNTTTAAKLANECPTCHAAVGAKCVTIYYVRQDTRDANGKLVDMTYAPKSRPTSPHKAR